MALRDQNVVSSFYPSSRHEGQEVFDIFFYWNRCYLQCFVCCCSDKKTWDRVSYCNRTERSESSKGEAGPPFESYHNLDSDYKYI